MKRRGLPILDELKSRPRIRLSVLVATWVVVLLLGIWLGGKANIAGKDMTLTATIQPVSTTPIPTRAQPSPTSTVTPTSASAITDGSINHPFQDGLMVFSLVDGFYRHLFVYHPSDLPLTRITDHPWDDIHPAVSPDGSRLAYASRRNGFWDIYVFNLIDGSSLRVTDSLAYDGYPTWSPDGRWLAFESYQNGNLDVFIQSLTDPTSSPVQLTDDPAPDFEPAWSPNGGVIAFTSLRSGEPEIWSAAVDQPQDRFTNLSRSPFSSEDSPAWSPDGRTLTWTASSNGSQITITYPVDDPDAKPVVIGNGKKAVWSPEGSKVLLEYSLSTTSTLAGIDPASRQLKIPSFSFESEIFGLDWGSPDFGTNVTSYLPENAESLRSLRVVVPADHLIDPATGRTGLVPLEGINAPHALLSDSVDESFNALRTEIARLSGWDVLANLENAYLPVTDPSNPGPVDDWLVTGLAFAINPLPYQAGWISIQREDIQGDVFWRVYIRARYQDGSQGMPLKATSWDLYARSSGDPQAYEEGGALSKVSEGYWVDLTELAHRFGWDRLPAQSNWQTYFSGTRFNQFAYTRGLDWETAMLELYPPELIHPPTRVPTLTSTPTSTSIPLNSRTATAQTAGRLLAPTNPDPRPTWTPAPGENFP